MVCSTTGVDIWEWGGGGAAGGDVGGCKLTDWYRLTLTGAAFIVARLLDDLPPSLLVSARNQSPY